MALTAMLYVDDATERRGSPRRRIGAETTVRRTGSVMDAVLHDLSTGGALIETSVPLAQGSTVTIGLAGIGRFAATVVTTSGLQAGCRFAQPLMPESLTKAFAADTVVAGAFHAFEAPPAHEEPPIVTYPGYVRVLLPVLGAACGWWMIVEAVRAAFA